MEITQADRDLAQKMILQVPTEFREEDRPRMAWALFIAINRRRAAKLGLNLDAEIKDFADALFLSDGEEITPRNT